MRPLVDGVSVERGTVEWKEGRELRLSGCGQSDKSGGRWQVSRVVQEWTVGQVIRAGEYRELGISGEPGAVETSRSSGLDGAGGMTEADQVHLMNRDEDASTDEQMSDLMREATVAHWQVKTGLQSSELEDEERARVAMIGMSTE